jgi:plastocyanin
VSLTRRAGAILPVLVALSLAGCDASGQLDPGLLTSVGTIRAKDIAFEPTAVTIRAGTAITITLENADDGIPHGLLVVRGDLPIAEAEIIVGPGRTTVELPPLDPGAYPFTCPVHPNMGGTITVAP